jgi:hypothetical protein
VPTTNITSAKPIFANRVGGIDAETGLAEDESRDQLTDDCRNPQARQ